MAKGKAEQATEISIMEVAQGELNVCILGESPLIYNAMSEKVRHELLMPAPKKNSAEKASNLKHDPFTEFRNCTYQNLGNKAATRLNFPSVAFKKAMAAAALDIPGAQKTQMGRLVWALGDRVDIFGVPQLFCAITRSADMNRTPDVRTRAILAEWACRVSFRFMKPILKDQTVVNLLAVAGFTQGIGDWRQAKGSGSYGQFKLVSADDKDFVRVCTAGIKAQDDALETPRFYDEETERLMAWFVEERTRREGTKKNGKTAQLESEAS